MSYFTVLGRVTTWLLNVSTLPDDAVHHTAVMLIENADPTNDPVRVTLPAEQAKSGARETLFLGRPRIFTGCNGLVGWWIWDAYLQPHSFPQEDVERYGENAYLAAAIRIAGTDNIKRVESPR